MSGAQASNSGAKMTTPASTSAVLTRGRPSTSQVSPVNTYPGTAVTAGDPFKWNVNHPTLRAPEGVMPMVPIPPAFWAESYPELKMSKAKRAPLPGEQEKPKPKFTAQQIRAAHQILQHGNSLATQASIQVQSAIEKAGVNDAVMLQFLQDKEAEPNTGTLVKTFEQPSRTRAVEQKNQTWQNNTMYGNYDFERGKAPKKEGVQMMWKGSVSYAKFDMVKNRPQAVDRRPPGPVASCSAADGCDDVLTRALLLNEQRNSDQAMMLISGCAKKPLMETGNTSCEADTIQQYLNDNNLWEEHTPRRERCRSLYDQESFAPFEPANPNKA